MKNGKVGLAAAKQTNPRHLNESKHPINFNAIKVGNQRIILRFNKDNRALSFDECGGILIFICWLQRNKYDIKRRKK